MGIIRNENVILEAHTTDVAVISDVKGANAENVVLEADRTTVAIETGSPRSAQEG